jgi:mediator of RNA polymerase II transcription subunit 22
MQTAAASQKALPQTKEALLKSYQKRLKDDIRAMIDNYVEIIKLGNGKVGEDIQFSRLSQAEQELYEVEVRAANVVRAAESLLKLVSDIKQFLILNDFSQVNEAIKTQNESYWHIQNKIDVHLLNIRDEMAADLFELEEEYYSSQYK